MIERMQHSRAIGSSQVYQYQSKSAALVCKRFSQSFEEICSPNVNAIENIFAEDW